MEVQPVSHVIAGTPTPCSTSSAFKYLLREDDWAEFFSKHLFQHGHQFLMVQVLHAVEVVEVQEHNLSCMSGHEATDLL